MSVHTVFPYCLYATDVCAYCIPLLSICYRCLCILYSLIVCICNKCLCVLYSLIVYICYRCLCILYSLIVYAADVSLYDIFLNSVYTYFPCTCAFIGSCVYIRYLLMFFLPVFCMCRPIAYAFSD